MQTIKTELELIRTNYDKTIELIPGVVNTVTGSSMSGLFFSQKNLIATIEFYSSSRYLNGQLDELGREKPFFNILNGICDVENAAKDLDTKDISVTSDDGNHYLESFMLSKDIQVWMKEADFAKTLNDIRDKHTRYGSVLVKKCYDKDEDGSRVLKIELPEWKNVITDQVNILDSPIVEVHWMTAKEISGMQEWDKDGKKVVLDQLKGKGSTKRVPVYEIRGMFARSTYKECDGKVPTEKDQMEYSYQLYYIAGQPTESGRGYAFTEGLTPLYWEDNTEKVYKYLKRKPKDGRDFGVGVMEEGEEAQVWTNDTVLKQFRAMEYTTKVVGQSASKKLKGRNLLTETDDGTILEHEEGKPITALNLLPSGGLQQYNNLITQWYDQLQKTTSAYSAQRGDTPPSGTPFRLQATVLQQSSSVFDDLREEMGIFITEIFEDWVLPHLAKQLNKEHILAYDFSPEELKEIDNNFSTRKANEMAVGKILNGEIVTPEDYVEWMDISDKFIKQTKGKRFISIPKDFYKNLEAKVTINVTGEQRNKAAVLESLNSILVTIAKNPGLMQDPVLSQIVLKIIELSGAGISPVSLTSGVQQQAQQAPQEPQPQAQPSPMSLEANPLPQ